MIRKTIFGLVICLLAIAGSAWALTPVLDTGDPNERVCNPKSYTDLGNGIVRDNVTGLEWMKTTPPLAYTWDGALTYVAGMNTGTNENYGYTDWRLPTIVELSTLVDAGRDMPAIDPIFSTIWSNYFSSTTDARSANFAWFVAIYDASVFNENKGNHSFVRAVRSGQSGLLDNFVNNIDGTITDTATGPMWQQCNGGQTLSGTECAGSAATQTWDQAVAYVQGLNVTHYLGYGDWRLPTRNELQSLVDYSRYNPATTFPNTMAFEYWSSTSVAGETVYAWYVNLYDGYVGQDSKNDIGDINYVRAVRGGSCECVDDSDCDDAYFCTGTETCVGARCFAGTNPCISQDLVCNEDVDQCVECLDDSNCPAGKECSNGACVAMSCTENWQCPTGFGCAGEVCVQEAPPVIGVPYLAAGSWPALRTTDASAFVLKRNYSVLWEFSDDYSTCSGLCTSRAKYRRSDSTQWFELQATMDEEGKWYAYTELPVNNMRDGTYVFQMEVVDCAKQITSSKYYYFKVAHPL